MASVRESSQQDRRVYVGNLSYDVKWHHLKDFMRQGELPGQSNSRSIGSLTRLVVKRARFSSPTSSRSRMACRRWAKNGWSIGLFGYWTLD